MENMEIGKGKKKKKVGASEKAVLNNSVQQMNYIIYI